MGSHLISGSNPDLSATLIQRTRCTVKYRVLAIATTFLLSTLGWGQSVDEYLAIRKKNKIIQPVPTKILDALVGNRVLEIRCSIKGTMDFDGKSSIYIEYPEGGEQVVTSPKVPDWIKGNPVEARMIVQANRSNEFAPLELTFIAVASEYDVAKYDPKAVSTTPPKASTQPRNMTNSSRGSAAKRPSTINLNVLGAYTDFIQNHNRRLSKSKAQEIAEAIIGWSLHYDVDARLVVALVIAESDFIPSTTSNKLAMGLGQLIPEIQQEFGVKNPYDTNENIYATVGLLKRLLNKYNVTESNLDNLKLALAGYNAGPGAVKKYGGVPPYRETQNYVRKIINLYNRLRGLS